MVGSVWSTYHVIRFVVQRNVAAYRSLKLFLGNP